MLKGFKEKADTRSRRFMMENKMWRLTILFNGFIVFGFWCIGRIAITPGYNFFVQYPEPDVVIDLPVLTRFVFSIRTTSIVVPLVWCCGSMLIMVWPGKLRPEKRMDWIQLHTSISIFAGLLILAVFALSGILPFLYIGTVLR